MDALHDLFFALTGLSHLELMLGLLITGTVIIVLEDWRLNLWALAAQVVLVGVLLVRVIPLQVALVKIIIGGMVCVILYLTARRVKWGGELTTTHGFQDVGLAGREVFTMNLWVRLLVALLVAVVTYALGDRHPFVVEPPGVSHACYWLAGIGLLTVVLTRDIFKVGLGLITFQAGFSVLLATFSKSLSVAALVGVVDILIALTIAYLTAGQMGFAVEDESA